MSNKILEQTLLKLTESNGNFSESLRAQQYQRLSTKVSSLGQVDELSTKLIEITAVMEPRVSPRTLIVCAADHGISAEGVTADSPESTEQAIQGLLNNKTQTAVLAQKSDTKICVLDVGTISKLPKHNNIHSAKIRAGTANFVSEPAMSEDEAIEAIAVGISIAAAEIQAGTRLLLLSNSGIGSSTTSAALAAVLTGLEIPEVTGPSSGLGLSGWRRKCEVIEQALLFHHPSPLDGLGLLSKIGGLEIAAMVGIILEATVSNIPVLLDGMAPAAGGAMATLFDAKTKKTLIAAHASSDPGHNALLDLLDLKPILDLDIQRRDGAGALLALPILEAALHADL